MMPISTALQVLSDFESTVDPQIYEMQKHLNFDVKGDTKYTVAITAGQWRQFTYAIASLRKQI